MSKKRRASGAKLYPRRGVTNWMMFTAIEDPRLLKQSRTVVLKYFTGAAEKTFDLLTDCSLCERLMLYDTLAMVERLQKCLPEIDRREVGRLANSLQKVLKNMCSVVPSHNMLVDVAAFEVEEPRQGGADEVLVAEQVPGSTERKTVRLRLEGTGGVLHVSPKLKSELEEKIKAYRELAQLELRHLDSLKHICELLPARYLHRTTGAPHFNEVATLLDWVFEDEDGDNLHDPDTMRKYYNQAGDAHCLELLDMLIRKMKETMGQWPSFRGFKDSDKRIYDIRLPE